MKIEKYGGVMSILICLNLQDLFFGHNKNNHKYNNRRTNDDNK